MPSKPTLLPPLTALSHAHLEWHGDEPQATDFDDVYFSREDGRRETEHVFIQHNQLPERLGHWHHQRPFVIAETGFGSGLNALCAWAALLRYAPPTARLHFVSTERFPMTRADLARALGGWDDVAEISAQLIAQWPEPVTGIHRLMLHPRFTLDLHFGEASACFGQLDGKVDAWFLDGFAPSKNPDMWSEALFRRMAILSQPGATFATFTAAGKVRRGLMEAGFQCEKVPGFGRKREMLKGAIDTPGADPRRQATPWFAARPAPATKPQHLAVIGAGIAGCSTAYALAKRGHRVTLLDPNGVAQEASGNPQAALYIKLAVATNLPSRFYLAALMHVRRLLASTAADADWWSGCGTLDIAQDEKQAERQRRFLSNHALPTSIVRGLSCAEATQLANTALLHTQGALFYPLGGWLDPVAFCHHLLKQSGCEHVDVIEQGVEALLPQDTGFRLTLGNQQQLDVDQVVVCSAYHSRHFKLLEHLPMMPVRGQVSRVTTGAQSNQAVAETPRVTICAKGYAPPPYQGRQLFGASFKPHVMDTTPSQEEAEQNAQQFAEALPDYAAALSTPGNHSDLVADAWQRAAIRTASPDKSPYAGPAPDAQAWRSHYAALSKDAKRIPAIEGPLIKGLWVNLAHGSRGMVSAPLCAEMIASRIDGEPAPLELAVVDHLHPGRRIIRDLITAPRHKGET